jgi:hypothetical protein
MAPPPLIVGLIMSGLETNPNARSAVVIVEVNRTSLFVWVEDIYNSNFMNVCTIYHFIRLVLLSMVISCFIGSEIFEDDARHRYLVHLAMQQD